MTEQHPRLSDFIQPFDEVARIDLKESMRLCGPTCFFVVSVRVGLIRMFHKGCPLCVMFPEPCI